MSKIRTAVLILTALCLTSFAQTTNNVGPGADATWPDAGKEGVGTSATLQSRVWFTLRRGVLTEVYYPFLDVANVQSLQFVVVNNKTGQAETESRDARHEIYVLNGLTFRQINLSRSGKWSISKTYITDPQRHTVLLDVSFTAREPVALYVRYDPSLSNSGMHDVGFEQVYHNDESVYGNAALLSFDQGTPGVVSQLAASALLATGGLDEMRTDYAGPDEALFNPNAPPRASQMRPGNIVQTARIRRPSRFTLALGFGEKMNLALSNAALSLNKGFEPTRREYEAGWRGFINKLPRVGPRYQAQFNMAAMTLKAHEDKFMRGANVASLSFPWSGNANEAGGSGYHAVWARDLYQVATAYLALNDKAAAERALAYLFQKQQRPDGAFPRNSWVDGRPTDGGLQLDQVAFPLILAYQLGRLNHETWSKHIRPAADFIVKNGPATPQERWEEKGGYSPSTIAAEIAGLVCAAEAARRNGDKDSEQRYLTTADEWAANVEKWTATKTGKYGDGNYYLRLSNNGTPDSGASLSVNNADPPFDEREIVDAGFLELVRLGIKRPDDPLIVKSLKVVDRILKVDTPNGAAWYRYNHDAYGEMDDGRKWNYDGKYSGRGRLWTLLTGERGEYEIALGDKKTARTRLDAMQKFANAGLMIPEQIWDRAESPKPQAPSPKFVFGEGTGSATPLCWSMAQFIRLARNLQAGRNLETPDIVARRYAKARS
jgi:glucoamylase